MRFSLPCCIVSISTLVLLLGGCDFPSDPPVRTHVAPVVVPSMIDTSKVLLPLAKGISWLYYGVSKNQQPQSYETTAFETKSNRGTFYRVTYSHNQPGAPPRPVFAFPSMLRNIPEGLAFYSLTGVMDTSQERQVYPAFVLPYPAQTGTVWRSSSPASDYSVQVMAKDTAIVDYIGETRRVYRYSVFDGGRDTTTFYVLPGKALLRIEHPDATFYTVAWIGIK